MDDKNKSRKERWEADIWARWVQGSKHSHLSIPTLTSLNVVPLLCLPRPEGQERGCLQPSLTF